MRGPIAVAIGLAFSAVAQASAVEVRLHSDAGIASIEGTLSFRRGSEEATRVNVRALEKVELPPGSYVATLDAPGWWMQPRMVIVSGSVPVDLSVKRTGLLTGTLNDATSTLSVRFSDAGDAAVSGHVPCVIEKPRFHCEVPTGNLDLRLSSPGFVPQYRWSIPVTTEHRAALGRIAFIPGASLSGQVRSEEGLLRNVRLSLVAMRGDKLQTSIVPEESGFFSGGPIPPGDYTLTGLQKGLVSAPVPVTIREGTESKLTEPLLLAKPRRLNVLLSPATTPLGHQWFVRLGRAGGEAVGSETPASLDGSWSTDSLMPGDYKILIRPDGGPVWHVEKVAVADALTLTPVTVRSTRFRGTVKLGDAPLQASVRFRAEDDAISIPWKSDERGELQGYLPVRPDGRWFVTVRSKNRNVHSTLTKVVDPTDGDVATIDIVVPDTRIGGVVVDETGTAVSRALVTLIGSSPASQQTPLTADEEGTFEFVGLPPDHYTIAASAYLQESNAVQVDLTDPEADIPELRLEVRPYRQWQGRVIGPDGRPVPGATVNAIAVDVPIATALNARTDQEGQFTVLVPSAARQFDFLVRPPGYAYKFFRRPFSDDLTIVVQPSGGTLVVEYPNDGRLAYLWHGGSTTSVYGFLSDWPTSFTQPAENRNRVRVPQLEPGEYTICLWPTGRDDWRTASPSGNCTSVFLAPHAEQIVTLKD